MSASVLQIQRFQVADLHWHGSNVFTLTVKPEEGSSFSFLPGQWVYLHLLNSDGTSLARAAFSIASAPEESDHGLQLGIKVYGEFTKQASQLKPGDRVGIQGPFGVFTLHENISPLVIFVGGIGITPFRSMIRSLAARKSSTEVILFYSNRTIEDMAYYDEFRELQKTWPSFRPVFIVTGSAPVGWTGETGRLDGKMVEKYVQDFSQGEFLMCGPPGFMDAVKNLLEAKGVDTKKRLRKELFG